jgi:hypothetical protein
MVNVLRAGEGRGFSRLGNIGFADLLVGLTCGGGAMVKILVEGDGCPWSSLGPAREGAVAVNMLVEGEDCPRSELGSECGVAVTVKLLWTGEGRNRSVVGLALEGMVMGGGGN